MKKSILTAIGIAFILLIYGYLASSAGVDHRSHRHGNAPVEEEHVNHGHGDHDDDHQH